MLEPEFPENEAQRLKSLKSYGILDSTEESDYDDITRLASIISGKKIALISLIDENRQWFKSKFGLDTPHTDRSISFCGHAINKLHEPFIINDATLDPRFSDNPLVTGNPNIIFYAGIPIVNDDNYALGTLCVIDDKPGELTEYQLESLKILSKSVLNLLKLRKHNLEMQEKENYLYEALEMNNRFYMVLNNVEGIDVFSSLFQKVIPELKVGRPFTDFCKWDVRFHFDKWTRSGAQKTTQLLFFDTLNSNQRFKFSLLRIGDKIFLSGAPVVNAEFPLTNYGLTLKDFAHHDYIIEYLFLQQSTDMTLKDSKNILEHMAKKNEELTHTYREMEILARFPGENPNPIIRLDYDLNAMFWNNSAEKTFLADFGISEKKFGDAMLNNTIQQLIQDEEYVFNFACTRNGHSYDITIINIKEFGYLNIYASDTTIFIEENRQLKIFYENILNYFPVDIAVFDKDHSYLYANRAGIKDEELRKFMIGKTDYDYCDYRNMPYDLADFRRDKFKQVIESKQNSFWEDQYLMEDGSVKYVERRFSPISFKEDEFDYVVGYGLDITKIKNSQKAVEEKNLLITEINNNLEKIVDEKTAQNLELTKTINNLDKMAMIGELTANITHDLNTPIGSIKAASESVAYTLKSLYMEALGNCTKEQLSWVFNRDTEIINISIGILQSLKEKEQWQCIFDDVLHYQGSNKDSIIEGLVRCRVGPKDIETVKYILEQSNSTELLELMYHTLVIKTFNDSILLSAEKAAIVIKNLRFYIKEGKLEERSEICLEESIRTVLKVFQHDLNKGVSVHFDAEPNLRIWGYESKIYQLWSNIIKNGIDAMEGSGNLFIKVITENGEKKVTISNDGPKIPNDVLPNIFNKFYTTKNRDSGTGLGLNIVKEIMDLLNITVSVLSDDELTSFTFNFKN